MKKHIILYVGMAVVMLVLSLAFSHAAAAGMIRYVIPVNGLTSGDCAEWNTACDLQYALGIAASGDEIWVAEGYYYPSKTAVRTATFQLKNGVTVYGGVPFGGTWDQRDWQVKATYLCGDVDRDGVMDSGNVYHVLTGSGTDHTAVLDGFYIIEGFADVNSPTLNAGGGMLNDSGSPTVSNVEFSNNFALYGGAMYNNSSNPTLINVTFKENYATQGGGMVNVNSSPRLEHITFYHNDALYNGGGMINKDSSAPVLTGVNFALNWASERGGGLYNDSSSPILIDVTFQSNWVDCPGTEPTNDCAGGGMFTASGDPTLTQVDFIDNKIDCQWKGPLVTSYCEGGGMYIGSGSPTLADVNFDGNWIDCMDGYCYGGAMYSSGSASLTDITFTSNHLKCDYVYSLGLDCQGGGIRNSGSLTLTDVELNSNQVLCRSADVGVIGTTCSGGGMHNTGTAALVNNVFYNNHVRCPYTEDYTRNCYGGGLTNDKGSTAATNVTFYANHVYCPVVPEPTCFWSYGGGLMNVTGSHLTLVNAIVWGNESSQVDGDASVTYSDIQGGWSGGTGNVSVNPKFVDPATGNLRLQPSSPAIDAGDNSTSGLNGIFTDLDGKHRFIDNPAVVDKGSGLPPLVDMGAYENGYLVHLPLVMEK